MSKKIYKRIKKENKDPVKYFDLISSFYQPVVIEFHAENFDKLKLKRRSEIYKLFRQK